MLAKGHHPNANATTTSIGPSSPDLRTIDDILTIWSAPETSADARAAI
jgi:hypothetical protein